MHSDDTITPQVADMTREQWLLAAVDEMRSMFKDAGYTIPRIYVSVGWPSSGGTSRKNKTIGQAWAPESSEDKTGHIFISPVLAESTRVLGVLVHEIGHIVVGVKHGHKAPFVRFCKAIGLEGKPTATTESDALKAKLNVMIEKIGGYPHARLDHGDRKVQGTRLLKVICPDCGYVIRVTRKWLDEGYPTCPCGTNMCDPDMVDDNDIMRVADSTIEYSAHDGRFTVRYVKKTDPRTGRITQQDWHVIDYEAHAVKASTIKGDEYIIEQGEAEYTKLPTRDDVMGFMEAVITGVYKYDDTEIVEPDDSDTPWDEEEDETEYTSDEFDYLRPDEYEDPDNPDDTTDHEYGDLYPVNPDGDEPVEIDAR